MMNIDSFTVFRSVGRRSEIVKTKEVEANGQLEM